jgi:PHD/YefM family antitoxin component YafN of YafNO toxin-antitoxin module
MLTVHPQYINDANGNKSLVVLPAKEFDSMMEQLEDLEDVRLYDKAKKRKQVFTDAETAFQRIEAERNMHVQSQN